MSETSQFSDAELVDLRRFCGYPALGAGESANLNGFRFFQAFGLLEFRLRNLGPAEAEVAREMLADLRRLDADIVGSSANLDTDVAAVWTRNRSEVRDRTRLLDDRRTRLCAFLGVPAGPDLGRSAGNAWVIV